MIMRLFACLLPQLTSTRESASKPSALRKELSYGLGVVSERSRLELDSESHSCCDFRSLTSFEGRM